MNQLAPLRHSTQCLMNALRNKELDSLPHIGTRGKKMSMPHGMSLPDAMAVVDVAMQSRRLRVASIRGTSVSPRHHTALLTHIAQRLPGSRVLCLNSASSPMPVSLRILRSCAHCRPASSATFTGITPAPCQTTSDIPPNITCG